jgi:hypothetical protein
VNLNRCVPLFLPEEETVPLTARISAHAEAGDSRSAPRHRLRLQVSTSSADQVAAFPSDSQALIYNLSRGGLLLETAAELHPGDMLVVDLPEAVTVAAEVVWSRDGLAGCKFERPLPLQAVSAARLRSEPLAHPVVEHRSPVFELEGAGEDLDPVEDDALTRALAMTGLIVALIVVAIFIIALFSFPFSER